MVVPRTRQPSLWKGALVSTLLFLGAAQAQTNPPCEVCGCNTCPPGFTTPVPGKVVEIPPEFADLVPAGIPPESITCGLLELVANQGFVTPEQCQIREDPDLRAMCECPPVPGPPETPQPTPTPTPEPTMQPVPDPTPQPTLPPTPQPTLPPTPQPTMEITPDPTPQPVADPTPAPSLSPTPQPTVALTMEPTAQPIIDPTPAPTLVPTLQPVASTGPPSLAPEPTELPIVAALPSAVPVATPSPVAVVPTLMPSMLNSTLNETDTNETITYPPFVQECLDAELVGNSISGGFLEAAALYNASDHNNTTDYNTTSDDYFEYLACDYNISHGVWYLHEGEGSLLTVEACSTEFDVQVAIFQGNCTDSPTCLGLAERTDECVFYAWPTQHGEEYLVLVHSTNETSMGNYYVDFDSIKFVG